MVGTVKTITARGFGFIKPDDGSGDLFFHASGLRGMTIEDLGIGDRVSFEVDEDENGRRRARDVRYMGEAEAHGARSPADRDGDAGRA